MKFGHLYVQHIPVNLEADTPSPFRDKTNELNDENAILLYDIKNVQVTN